MPGSFQTRSANDLTQLTLTTRLDTVYLKTPAALTRDKEAFQALRRLSGILINKGNKEAGVGE